MSWDEIAARYGTDKSREVSFAEVGAGHGYMDHYERILAGRRVERMVEIGVYEGASLRTWAEIWPDADIWGIDINPAPQVEGATILRADARNAGQLYDLRVPWHFDLVIDDSDHLLGTVDGVMDNFVPRLAAGGLYVVEDTRDGWPVRDDGMVVSTAVAEWLLVDRGLTIVETPASALTADGYAVAMVVAEKPR